MKQFSKDLGNVSLAPKGKWSREQEYERLALVYNACDNLSYVAKINVPIGVDIENREYWQPMNATGYADNNFINLTIENENGTITAYESIEEAIATIVPINRRVGATLSFYNLNADRLDRQAEFELWQFNSTDLANWENKDYWNNIYYNWNVFAGWYVGADALKNHVETPNVGQYAYVGSNLNDALLYQCRTNGTWTNTGIKVRNYISVVVSGNITIGENGNWFSDGEDTGIPATPAVDEQIDNIINKHESLSRTVQGIAATGGASTATNVTYNNDSSGLNAENAQDAIDELQGSKIDKTSILQELGTAKDKVMSQKAVSSKFDNLSIQVNNLEKSAFKHPFIPVTNGYYVRKNTGGLVEHDGGAVTDYQSISNVSEIIYTGVFGYYACIIAFYDANKKFISSLGDSDRFEVVENYKISSFPSNSAYFRASFVNYDTTKSSVSTNLMKGEQYLDINSLETNIGNTINRVDSLETKINNIKTGIEVKYNVSNITTDNAEESTYFGSLFSEKITINTLKYIARKPKTDNKIIVGTFVDNKVIVNYIMDIPDAVVGENTVSNLNISILPNQVLFILGNDTFNNRMDIFENALISSLGVKNIDSIQVGNSANIYKNLQITKTIQIAGYITKHLTEENIKDILGGVTAPNYLNGKVLSVTGDSEAAGHTIGKQNTYGALIANRNKMIINNYAINGRKLITGTETSLVNTYTEIAKNSDYILVQIGYNDKFNIEIDDNSDDITTFKGAFNVLVKGLQSNYPKAKIGFIEPYYFSGTSLKPRAAWVKERCEFYHVQCIDGTTKSGLRKDCAEQSDYFIDAVHLTALGHERMSYIYENFLRGL